MVRIHVDGAVRSDGYYDPNDPDADRATAPSVGCRQSDGSSNSGDWTGENEESDWRGVSITAHKNVETPIPFMHDVLDAQSECPPALKGLGELFVSIGSISNPNPNPNPNPIRIPCPLPRLPPSRSGRSPLSKTMPRSHCRLRCPAARTTR